MSETGAAPSDLREAAFSGVRWTGLSAIVLTVLQAVQFLILVRFLSPGDFGVYAILMIPISLAMIFADGGMSVAILQRKHVSPEHLSSLYWLNVVVGFALCLLLLATTPLVARVVDRSEILYLLPIAALVLAVSPFGIQFQVQMQKDLGFAKVSFCEIASAVAASVVSISVAVTVGGALSLVLGQLAGAIVRSALFAWYGWSLRPMMLRLRFEDIRGYMNFALFTLGERTVQTLASRLDQLVLGLALGINAVGYYNVAANLTLVPMARVGAILPRVLLPVFSRLQDDAARQAKAFLSSSSAGIFVVAPSFLGLAALAQTVVPVVTGTGWEPTIDIVRAIAIVVVLRIPAHITALLLLSNGRAKWSFLWTLGSLAVELPAVWLGAITWGLAGAAFGLLLAELAIFAANLQIVRRLRLPVKLYAITLGGPIAVAALTSAIVYTFDTTLNPHHSVELLIVAVGLGALTFGVGSLLLFKETTSTILGLLPLKRRRRLALQVEGS